MHVSEPQNPRFYIFCSDRPRNGKTLLCRLFCANLPVNEPGRVHIFDTDPTGDGIASYHPEITSVVDFHKTAGRVKLFDTVMARQHRYVVLDLLSVYLDDYATTSEQIIFDQAASEAGVHVVIYYVMDKSQRSLEKALSFKQQFAHSEFFILSNESIGGPDIRQLDGSAQSVISTTRILRFPQLSPELVDLLENRDFDLYAFMSGQVELSSYVLKLELWNLLELLYQQRTPDSKGVTHFL